MPILYYKGIRLLLQSFFLLEFPQNYPPKINLLSFVIHNFQKMAKI